MAIAAIGQITSTISPSHNLHQCITLIHLAASRRAHTLFLPEASDWISRSPEESAALVRSVDSSEFVNGIRAAAREVGVNVCVGVHEPCEGGDVVDGKGNGTGGGERGEGEVGKLEKVKNTLLWIDESGEIRQRYQKVHLFDMALTDGINMRESRSVEKGMSTLPPFQTSLGRLGLMICFDLRFPEISLSIRRQGAEILTYPSAFTIPTGQAHWEPLLRARAIETQSYVIAAAQVGRHNETRASYGHSMIVDPWGKVLAELGGEATGPELAIAEIDLESVERVRREMFLVRRTDVYPEI